MAMGKALVMPIGRDDHPAASDLVPNVLRWQVLALGDPSHLRGEHPAPRKVHLRAAVSVRWEGGPVRHWFLPSLE
jgi:hypothetical protein